MSDLNLPMGYREKLQKGILTAEEQLDLLRRIEEKHTPCQMRRDSVTVSSARRGSVISTASSSGRHLSDLIEERLVKSQFSSQKPFLPAKAFAELVTRGNIERELERWGVEDHDGGLAKYISSYASRTFAILACCGLVDRSGDLVKFEFRDSRLPIERAEGGERGDARVRSARFLGRDDPTLEWFRSWENWHIKNFCTQQWSFLSIVFTDAHTMEDLHADCPLPFLKFEGRSTGGSFSLLYKATIHPDHQCTSNPGTILAIKELINREANADKQAEVEVSALKIARQLEHEHLMKFVAGFRQNSKRYLMFLWADGGNLREFWNECKDHTCSEVMIKWSLGQMLGLSGALDKLHNHSQINCRHGDLKPENIVRAPDLDDLGRLLIADMGLAKIHSLPTRKRNNPSLSGGGTFRYSSPEIGAGSGCKISRSYDMWSIGCVLLEFVIWLLYGKAELDRFDKACFKTDSDAYYDPSAGNFDISPDVKAWIQHMEVTCLRRDEPCVSPALRRLFYFIKDRLLVEDHEHQDSDQEDHDSAPAESNSAGIAFSLTTVPTMQPAVVRQGRAKSEQLYEVLYDIMKQATSELPSYIHNPDFSMVGKNRRGPQCLPKQDRLVPTTRGIRSTIVDPPLHTQVARIPNTHDQYAIPAGLDVWNTHTDNQFAKDVYQTLTQKEITEITPAKQSPGSLCDGCSSKTKGLLSPGLFAASIEELDRRRGTCALCALLHSKLRSLGTAGHITSIIREGSSLTTRIGGSPAFSVVVGPQLDVNDTPMDIQRGLPKLPLPGSDVQVKLLKQWLRRCDKWHRCNKPSSIKPHTTRMPTRLVDLGNENVNTPRLDCRRTRSDTRFTALTHRWGDTDIHEPFYLQKGRLKEWQRSMDLDHLPKTYQDAIHITRSLGIRYIWIDALCIVQDDRTDLESEIQKMEDVFTFAYVSLSATCATGNSDGFLKRTRERQCHPFDFPSDGQSQNRVWLCDPIDNFKRDVEQSALSKRGWVFQERALSRRIIHFTDTQVYWECGVGILCESLTKLYNQKTSFFSDPDFPESMSKTYKGVRILFFEEIYETYSRLDFTMERDRSVGMAGLETRLARVYNARARYGLLDVFNHPSYLRRSLLWQRASKTEALRRIRYPEHRQVPTWSWMALMGPIAYVDIPFDVVVWSDDLESPFNEHLAPERDDVANTRHRTIRGAARTFVQQPADEVVLDREPNDSGLVLTCVVLGTQHQDGRDRHYGIVVSRIDGQKVYERIGVVTFERTQEWLKTEGTLKVEVV